MNWASIAILSAASFSVVNIVDSHLLSKRMPGLRALLLLIGCFQLFYGLLIFWIFPLPAGIGVLPVLVAVASGIFRSTAAIIMLYNLRREDVSRVIPVVYTYPIIVAIIAVLFLGETLAYLQWLAIIIVVAGAVMVSLQQSPSGATIWLGKPFLLLLGSSLFFALADITSKYALAYISPWNMFGITSLCLFGVFWLISVRPSVINQLVNMKGRNSALALLTFSESLVPVASVLSFLALERGPVSLVSTIIGSRPIFVVIYALILSRILPGFLKWQSGGGMLALRLVAVAMIFGGIAIIYLT